MTEHLTVAEAALRFGVSQRRVRHVLDKLRERSGEAPQGISKAVRGANGERTATAYPVELLTELLTERSAPEPQPEPAGTTVNSELLSRALVAEARAELLERELADWKEQARAAMEAMQRAQEESRAARLLPTREAVQIEAQEEAQRVPWWRFSGRKKGP